MEIVIEQDKSDGVRIAELLSEMRRARGLTLRAVCDSLPFDISPAALHSYEQDADSMSVKRFFALFNFFDLSISTLDSTESEEPADKTVVKQLMEKEESFRELVGLLGKMAPSKRRNYCNALVNFLRSIDPKAGGS